jgi:hypothetical protein
VTILAAQIPDEPISLANIPTITCANKIGLSWQAPSFNGGSVIIDYRVWTDQANGSNFVILAQGVT